MAYAAYDQHGNRLVGHRCPCGDPPHAHVHLRSAVCPVCGTSGVWEAGKPEWPSAEPGQIVVLPDHEGSTAGDLVRITLFGGVGLLQKRPICPGSGAEIIVILQASALFG